MEFIFVFQKLHNHFISIPSQEKYESFRDAHGVYECHIFAFGFLIHLTDVRKFMKLDKSQAIARVWMLKSISYSTYFGTKSTELFFFFFFLLVNRFFVVLLQLCIISNLTCLFISIRKIQQT